MAQIYSSTHIFLTSPGLMYKLGQVGSIYLTPICMWPIWSSCIKPHEELLFSCLKNQWFFNKQKHQCLHKDLGLYPYPIGGFGFPYHISIIKIRLQIEGQINHNSRITIKTKKYHHFSNHKQEVLPLLLDI